MISIRAASSNDASAIAGLLGELGYPSAPEQVRTRMARLLATNGDRDGDRVFVASEEQGGEAVGFLSLHRFQGLHDEAPIALITALVVTERARGQSVGRQLVDCAVATARGWGCARLMVTTNVRRADAHAFYEQIGFELTGRRYVRTL